MNDKLKVKELTIMLLYLTSWAERDFCDVQRSWKGYNFDILNELTDEGLISNSRRSKSVVISEEGVNHAKDLLIKYGLDFTVS